MAIHKFDSSPKFTLFVDNLPDDVGVHWFRHFFSQFGAIRRAFIPKKKRSKRSGQPFGFITFGSKNEAYYAISKSNSLRLDGRNLLVKWARFQPKNVDSNSSKLYARNNLDNLGNSSSEPVLGSNNQPREFVDSATFNVKPLASEWLSRSAVVLLKDPSTPDLVSKALDQANFPDVSVKSLGGLSMIFTFCSKEVRNLALSDSTLKDWFISLKPWNGESASLSRFVWLKCRGMPLQSWNINTFKLIGDYCGVFINTDVETALEHSYDVGRILISTDYSEKIEEWINIIVNGKVYKVRIWEEDCDDPFNTIFNDKVNIGVQTEWLKEKDREVIHDSDVAEKKGMEPIIKSMNDSKEAEVALPINTDDQINNTTGSNFSSSGIGSSSSGNERVLDTFEVDPNPIITASCYMAQHPEENQDNHDQGDDALIDDVATLDNPALIELGCSHRNIAEDNQVISSNDVLNEEGEHNHNEFVEVCPHADFFDCNSVSIQATVKGAKGKKKRKNIDEILGNPKVNKWNQKGRKGSTKCVVFRSAIAAAALSASVSSEGICNRNKNILSEAQAIRQMNRIIGYKYDGEDEEVISKIAELEAQDKEGMKDKILTQ